MYKLCIIGTAIDGPCNQVWVPTSETQLKQVLGGNYTQRCYITPTASSQGLDYLPWLTPSNSVNGQVNQLFNPAVSGQLMTFGPIGQVSAPETNLVDLSYTPYLGLSDLIFAARKHNQVNQYLPYVARIGGTFATLSVSGWDFESRYAGLKYNKVWVISDGVSSVTVGGLDPDYPVLKYTGPASDIQEQMYSDYLWGICPCSLSYTTTLIPIVSGYLSGGSDGTITGSSISEFLRYTDIPSDCTHILFLEELDQNLVNAVYAYNQSPTSQPRLYMCNAPSYTSPTSSYVTTVANAVPLRHDFVTATVGKINTVLDGQDTTRYAAEGVAIAFSNVNGKNITNIAVDATSFSPELSGDDLAYLKGSGLMAITRHIGKGVCTYQGCTIASQKTFVWNSKICEILSTSATYCEQYIGQYFKDGPQPTIAAALSALLDKILFLELDWVEVTTIYDTMTVTISGAIDSEILNIQFTVRNK